MHGRAPSASAVRRATTSDVLSRSASMSNSAMVEPASSGTLRMSPSRFFAKTVLPAPMNVIFGISAWWHESSREQRLEPLVVAKGRMSGQVDAAHPAVDAVPAHVVLASGENLLAG